MTTEHITQEQIESIYARYGGDMANCAHSIARQAVANYIEQRAKELPVLPKPDCPKSGTRQPENLYTESKLQAYALAWGDHRAAHARELALEEAKQAAENCDVVEAKGNTYYAQLGDAAATQRCIVAAIEALKGK